MNSTEFSRNPFNGHPFNGHPFNGFPQPFNGFPLIRSTDGHPFNGFEGDGNGFPFNPLTDGSLIKSVPTDCQSVQRISTKSVERMASVQRICTPFNGFPFISRWNGNRCNGFPHRSTDFRSTRSTNSIRSTDFPIRSTETRSSVLKVNANPLNGNPFERTFQGGVTD